MSFDIVISYRRADSQPTSNAIYRELVRRFGADRVLFDITSVPAGEDYDSYVRRMIVQAKAVILVIGPRWLTVEKQSVRRIDREDDVVRGEVVTALQANIPIIPLLVDDAVAIEADALPEPLKPLSRLSMMPVEERHWDAEMDALEARLAPMLGVAPQPAAAKHTRKARWPIAVAAAVALSVAGAAGYVWMFPSKSPTAGAVTSPRQPVTVAESSGVQRQPTPQAKRVPVPIERRPLTITNIHESGRSRMYTLVLVAGNDLSYGAGFVSLQRGSLHAIAQRYVAAEGARFGQEMSAYLKRLQAKDAALLSDDAFKALLVRVAGEDPIMPRIQDEQISERFLEPARIECQNIGIRSALGFALIADVRFNFGPARYAAIKQATIKNLDGTPVTGVDEHAWLRKFAEQTIATQKPQFRHMTERRMATFIDLMNAGNWTLQAPVPVGGFVLIDP